MTPDARTAYGYCVGLITPASLAGYCVRLIIPRQTGGELLAVRSTRAQHPRQFGGIPYLPPCTHRVRLPRPHDTGIIECNVAVCIWEGAGRARGFLLNISGQTV
jgi:hypothetical protein